MKRSKLTAIATMAVLAMVVHPAVGGERQHRGGGHHQQRHQGEVIFHGFAPGFFYGIYFDFGGHRFQPNWPRRHRQRHHHHQHRGHRRQHGGHQGWNYVPSYPLYMDPNPHRHRGHGGRRHHHGDHRWHRHGDRLRR